MDPAGLNSTPLSFKQGSDPFRRKGASGLQTNGQITNRIRKQRASGLLGEMQAGSVRKACGVRFEVERDAVAVTRLGSRAVATAMLVLEMFVPEIPESRFREKKSQTRAQDLQGPPTHL